MSYFMLVDPIIFYLWKNGIESLKFQQIYTTCKHLKIIGMFHIKAVIINYTKIGDDVAITDILNQSNISEVQKRCSNILNTMIRGLTFGNHLATLRLWIKNICGDSPGFGMNKSSVQGLGTHT